MPGSQHLACTVEMVPLARRVDVAIIDEIQARSLRTEFTRAPLAGLRSPGLS